MDFSAIPNRGQSADSSKAVMVADIHHNISKAKSVEDPSLQQQALALMPLSDIRQEAVAAVELDLLLTGSSAAATTQPGADDLVVQGLLHWFKHKFFKWVDQAPCDFCGSQTSLVGMSAPTPAEAADGAGRVEQYRCTQCQQMTRFPRYTSARKLLETRRGRCGEWAQAFLLFLRAAGYDARHVMDSSDHVWCEYYSEALGRWVHVDACEEVWDKPLLYEAGWGKQLVYVFAASIHGVADVSRRYVVSPADLPSRRHQVPEPWLRQTLSGFTSQLRSGLDMQTRRMLAVRDATEVLQLMSLEDQQQGNSSGSGVAAAADLPGRQSGSEAWRHARGETGASSSSAAAPAPTATASQYNWTRYKRAPDQNLPTLLAAANRITGGACRASGENGHQAAGCLFDGSLDTKWLDFGGGGQGGSAAVEYRILPNQPAVVLSHYDVVAAEDCPERDPCDWVLECLPAVDACSKGNSSSSSRGFASSTDSDGWVVVDKRSGERFGRRHQLRSVLISAEARVLSRQWRLRVTGTADPAAANSVQICCWNLYSSNSSGGSASSSSSDGSKQEQFPTVGYGTSSCLYLTAGLLQQLQQLLASYRAAVQHADTAVDSSSNNAAMQYNSIPTSDPRAPEKLDGSAVVTLLKILRNMQQHPHDSKFWQLSATAARLQPVLQSPPLLAVALEAGFRPLVALQGQEQQLRLVAEESAQNLAVVDKLLKHIQGCIT